MGWTVFGRGYLKLPDKDETTQKSGHEGSALEDSNIPIPEKLLVKEQRNKRKTEVRAEGREYLNKGVVNSSKC